MVWIGTSGYDYPEWKGTFYPPTLPASQMLPFYAQHFATVEINYTFYRTPTARAVSAWADATPEHFRFALKAPRWITHVARLQACAPRLKAFCDAASALGGKLGVLLFQLPPNFKKDAARLDAFLDDLPPRASVAFEFRHPSWHDPEVLTLLKRRGIALCVVDRGAAAAAHPPTPVLATAGHAYFRLRDEGYQAENLARWATTIRQVAAGCDDVFVYFKHEEAGLGPAFARMLQAHLGGT